MYLWRTRFNCLEQVTKYEMWMGRCKLAKIRSRCLTHTAGIVKRVYPRHAFTYMAWKVLRVNITRWMCGDYQTLAPSGEVMRPGGDIVH
jgi:hypothetical protein